MRRVSTSPLEPRPASNTVIIVVTLLLAAVAAICYWAFAGPDREALWRPHITIEEGKVE